jgi:hypothetical protein
MAGWLRAAANADGVKLPHEIALSDIKPRQVRMNWPARSIGTPELDSSETKLCPTPEASTPKPPCQAAPDLPHSVRAADL